MAKPTSTSASAADLARSLIAVADVDTVLRDVYLRRAHAALATELPAERYHGLRDVARKIEDAVARSRAAAIIQDWKLVHDLASEADQLRRTSEALAGLQAVGELVYDAPPVALDPFSPGLATLAKAPDLAKTRDDAVAALGKLAAADAGHAPFYEQRRAYLTGLAIARRAASADTETAEAGRSVAELERAALEAARRGDLADLQRLSQEILAQKAARPADPKPAADAALATPLDGGACPVDLGAPLPAAVDAKARALGLAVTRTEPLPQAAPLFDYVAARIGQAALEDATSEHEGTMKIEALVDQSVWPAGVSEHVKTLVGQFVRNVFVSSGGARYRPVFAAETVLIEDFPEHQEPPASSPLLTALGLPRRQGLTRDEIEAALLARGASVLGELALDAVEHRLVCVPHDLYSRVGRDRGWGNADRWTHFDGYQVLKGGRLRALVGGHARYGGLQDLTSVATSDRREGVVARFAVVRRARQVARWR
jgi:hypothetical protein